MAERCTVTLHGISYVMGKYQHDIRDGLEAEAEGPFPIAIDERNYPLGTGSGFGYLVTLPSGVRMMIDRGLIRAVEESPEPSEENP